MLSGSAQERLAYARSLTVLSGVCTSGERAPAGPPHGSIAFAKLQLAPYVDPEEWVSINPRTSIEYDNLTVRLSRAGCPTATFVDNVPRIAYVRKSTFHVSGSDLPQEPVVLTGCSDSWPAILQHGWSVRSLASRCDPTSLFAVDGGPAVARESLSGGQVTMQAYLQYAQDVEKGSVQEAAPLYIFDPLLSTRAFSDGSLFRDEFTVPHCFSQDTQAGCSKERPLPPCWLLVGAQGSGTPIHDHPSTVSNHTLLCGCKLWVLLPPTSDPSLLLLGQWNCVNDDVDLAAIDWMLHWHGAEEGHSLPDTARVIVQKPEDTVFAPAGWWHCVLNLECSTAISHSVALRRDFEAVWPALKAAEGPGDTFADSWAAHVRALDSGVKAHESGSASRVGSLPWGTV